MMKKLLYTLSLLVILGACRREEDEPEMLVVTTADMVGTWVCHNEGKGTFELMKFTADGEFYLTDRLDNFLFEEEVPGTYSFVSINASVMANHNGEKRSFNVTGLTGNSMTLQHKSTR